MRKKHKKIAELLSCYSLAAIYEYFNFERCKGTTFF